MPAAIADPAPPICASAVLPAPGTDAPAADFLALLTSALDAQAGPGAAPAPTARAAPPNVETTAPSFAPTIARTALGPEAPPPDQAENSAPLASAAPVATPGAPELAPAPAAPAIAIAPSPPQAPPPEPAAAAPVGKSAPDAKINKPGTPRPPPADGTAPTPTPSQPGTALPLVLPPPPATDPAAPVLTSADPPHASMAADMAKSRPERANELAALAADKIAGPGLPPEAIPQALQLPSPPGHPPALEPPTPHVTVGPGVATRQPLAGQVGTAFVVLGREGDGTHQLTLLLQPPDLGMVRISIEQDKNSPARVSLTAVNTSTLLTLLRDQPALNDALDKAGIQGDGRVLIFHLADLTEAPPVIAAPAGQTIGDAAQSFGMSGQTSSSQSDRSGRNGQDPPLPRTDRPGFADTSPGEPIHPAPATRQALTSIDITA